MNYSEQDLYLSTSYALCFDHELVRTIVLHVVRNTSATIPYLLLNFVEELYQELLQQGFIFVPRYFMLESSNNFTYV